MEDSERSEPTIRLAFALHARLPRRFRFAWVREGGVGNLDLAAALVVRDHEARASAGSPRRSLYVVEPTIAATEKAARPSRTQAKRKRRGKRA